MRAFFVVIVNLFAFFFSPSLPVALHQEKIDTEFFIPVEKSRLYG